MAINLTVSGSPTFVTGKFGNALDSTNGYLITSTLYGAATSAGTMEAWVKTTSTSTIVAAGNDTTNLWLGQFNTGRAVFNYQNGVNVSSTGTINDGSWHHLAGILTGSNAYLYVDGVLVGSAATGTTFNLSTGSTAIGQYANTSGYRWVGQIDEVRFSNVARYSGSSFTVATSAFTTDTNTLGLYHLEADGTDSANVDAVAAISGLSARYRADSITGVANGGSVASWPDTSGNAYTATQATAANQPTLTTSSINGKPAATFNGTSMYINSSAPAGISAQTIVVVVKAVNNSAIRTIRGGATGSLQFRIGSDGSLGLVKQNTAGIGISTANYTDASATVLIATYDSSSGAYAFYRNGSAVGSGTSVQSLTSSTTNIGYNSAGNEYFQGDIAELIVYSKVLSSSERSSVDSYVQDRYAITVSDYVVTSTNTTTSRFVRNTDLTNLVLAITGIQASNTQTANYTLAKTDVAKVVEMNVASANTLTIPANATVAFPIGSLISVYQGGAGMTTVSPASGVTLRSSAGSALKSQYAVVSLRQRAIDEWVISGNTTVIAVQDSFNRANNSSSLGTADSGQTWTQATGWSISSNQASWSSASDGGAIINSGLTDNYTVQFTAVSVTGQYPLAIFLRGSSLTAGNGIKIAREATNNYWWLDPANNGSTRIQVGDTTALVNGDVIKVTVASGTVTLYVNNGQRAQWTSVTQQSTGTFQGLIGSANITLIVDNFSVF